MLRMASRTTAATHDMISLAWMALTICTHMHVLTSVLLPKKGLLAAIGDDNNESKVSSQGLTKTCRRAQCDNLALAAARQSSILCGKSMQSASTSYWFAESTAGARWPALMRAGACWRALARAGAAAR